MDGFLLDTERICLDEFVQARRAFDLPDNPEIFLQCVGLRGEACAEIISDSLHRKASLEDFNKEWDARISAALDKNVPIKPGALELLQILNAQGHPMAVATSTKTQTATRHLEASDLLKYFECIVGGDQVLNHKPRPEPYHKAAALLGLDARNCVAFEDSDTGVLAAVASGAKTVQVPDLVPPSDDIRQMGHLIAPSLIAGALSIGLIEASDQP